MIYKSLILGVLFSIGIFAVKSGVGGYYAVSRQEKRWVQLLYFLLFALTYFLVFAAAFFVLREIDLLRHLAAIQNFIRSGMLVHLIMAGMMMVWGAMLLKQQKQAQVKSRAWLMLVVPCPVCVTVIFFSAGFLMSCFPDRLKTVIWLLYFGFLLIHMVTVVVVSMLQHRRPTSPESLLGGAMMLIAVYFFLSVTIMPQFADMDKIYRMALYQGKAIDKNVLHILFFAVIAATAFLSGYGFRLKQIRSAT